MVGESQEAVGAGVGGSSSGSNKMPTLEEYGTNLTRQAEEVSSSRAVGALCAVICYLLGCSNASQYSSAAQSPAYQCISVITWAGAVLVGSLAGVK